MGNSEWVGSKRNGGKLCKNASYFAIKKELEGGGQEKRGTRNVRYGK